MRAFGKLTLIKRGHDAPHSPKEDAMKVNMGAEIVDLDGKTILEQVPTGQKNLMGQPIMEDGGPLTLATVSRNALVAVFQDETTITGEEKVKRWALAMRIKKGAEADLSVEEIVLIKKLIGKAYGAVVCGPAWAALEGNA
jgi:hypothetical protein